ncbi:Muskelin 1, intracellular mediator containing kelch motif [Desmophyllum pertusum]|uniref:Muskelin 1, intracellular mediator containing kelch motif n=1 Tax=Desmophyllum pertusum TaxID=174260 RepID=A0A9W9YZ68_9CNID|nr:Muskelin 1, intracellular mediator containing kelch motif [Desmophyllum pertusum]
MITQARVAVPIMSWGPSSTLVFWFVELSGVDDPEIVEPSLAWFNTKRTKITLEHPVLTELHQKLVINNDFDGCEIIIEQASKDAIFSHYISQQDYKPRWTAIIPLAQNEDSSCSRPGMRGGHQMSIDMEAQVIYLLGGWDGMVDLADFWAFSVESAQWTCLSRDSEQEGGPCARSCHKMCLDGKRKLIYTLGRYLDSEMRNSTPLKSDFYVYDITSNQWTLISEDTSSEGGPPLIFDHQLSLSVFYRDDCPELRSRIGHSMLFHPEKRLLYIFAGQRGREFLSDFITYNVDTHEISFILDGSKKDCNQVPAAGFTQKSKQLIQDLMKSMSYQSCVYKNENMGQQYMDQDGRMLNRVLDSLISTLLCLYVLYCLQVHCNIKQRLSVLQVPLSVMSVLGVLSTGTLCLSSEVLSTEDAVNRQWLMMRPRGKTNEDGSQSLSTPLSDGSSREEHSWFRFYLLVSFFHRAHEPTRTGNLVDLLTFYVSSTDVTRLNKDRESIIKTRMKTLPTYLPREDITVYRAFRDERYMMNNVQFSTLLLLM